MTFQREVLSRCPSCKALSATVIETRYTAVSTRRRKECRDCGYKFTTHEVQEDYFQEAKINQMLIARVKKAIDLAPVTETESVKDAVLLADQEESDVECKKQYEQEEEEIYRCDKCAHMMKNTCTLGIPEFNTDDASECVYYVVDEGDLLTALGVNIPVP